MSTDTPPDSHSERPDAASEVSGRRLAAKTGIVGGMTMISRVLGLARDIVFARYFGAGIALDAFLVANRIPNMLRRFFAEGAFSAGFVPVLGRFRENASDAEAREFIDAMAGTFAVVLFAVTLLGVLGAPLLVLVVAPGFVGDGGDFDLAALLLRFTFPYLLFVSLTAFAGGILNTFGRFAVPAFTPVILNIVLIAAAVWLSPRLEEPVMALAYAVLAAGVLQLLFQLPFLARLGVLGIPRWRPSHPGVKRAFALMVPAIFGSSVAQINVLLGGIIASLLGVGSISYLYLSDRLMEFPLGLFGIALATVTLPYLSRLWSSGAAREFGQTLDWSMKITALIAVPAAIGLILLAEPLVATLFLGRVFDAHDVEMTALALQAYAAGLVGFSYVKVLAPAFFAREDTRTPVRFAIVALVVNAVLSIVSAWYLTTRGFAAPHVGLAAATSVAALVNALLLYRGLRAQGVLEHAPDWLPLIGRIAVANLAMWYGLHALQKPLAWWVEAGELLRVAWLAASVAAGAGIYFAVLIALGLRPSLLNLKR
ncbi:MAG: murein biosynthesis integral membrane protein MurJ [Pseudomonadota bacterium]